MTGIGHNQGPTMEQGGAWRSYAWGRARKELLPRMPIEIVRRRVRRPEGLGHLWVGADRHGGFRHHRRISRDRPSDIGGCGHHHPNPCHRP